MADELQNNLRKIIRDKIHTYQEHLQWLECSRINIVTLRIDENKAVAKSVMLQKKQLMIEEELNWRIEVLNEKLGKSFYPGFNKCNGCKDLIDAELLFEHPETNYCRVCSADLSFISPTGKSDFWAC